MNGARLTSCKSAKDRTGMAVTYEMCMILGNEYDLLHGVFQQVLNAVRRYSMVDGVYVWVCWLSVNMYEC